MCSVNSHHLLKYFFGICLRSRLILLLNVSNLLQIGHFPIFRLFWRPFCYHMQLIVSFLVFAVIHLERGACCITFAVFWNSFFSVVVVHSFFFLMMWVFLLFVIITFPGLNYLLFGYIHIIIIVTWSGVLYHVEWMRSYYGLPKTWSIKGDPMIWPHPWDVILYTRSSDY